MVVRLSRGKILQAPESTVRHDLHDVELADARDACYKEWIVFLSQELDVYCIICMLLTLTNAEFKTY